MTTNIQLGSLGRYTYSASLEDIVRDYLGEFVHEFDVGGLVYAYRGRINEQLQSWDISMHGDEFYGVYPPPEDYEEAISAAIAAADLRTLAPYYELEWDAGVVIRGRGLRIKLLLVVAIAAVAIGLAVAFAT